MGVIEFSIINTIANNTNIQESIKNVSKAIDDLRGTIDMDSDNMINYNPNNLAKQESLRSKVKESGVTLSRTKKVCKFMR